MIVSLNKPENFKEISGIADEHTMRGPRESSNSNFHFVGRVLHDAAAKLGKASGLSWDHPLVQHHANSAILHQKHESESGYETPTEGPHAPLKGGFLGQPVINTPGK